MNADELLIHLAKDYEYHIFLAKKVNANNWQDLISDSYLKLHKSFSHRLYEHNNLTADRTYMFLTLRSINANFYKQNKISNIDINLLPEPVDYDDVDNNIIEDKLLDEIKLADIQVILNSLKWYDKQLFELYYTTNMSMRKIAKETGISLSSIHTTINYVKNELKNKLN